MTTGIDFSRIVRKQKSVKQQSFGEEIVASRQAEWADLTNRELLLLLINKLRPHKMIKGAEDFKDPSKRMRMLMFSLIIPVLFMVTFLILPEIGLARWSNIIMSGFLAIIAYLLAMWSLKFELDREGGRSVLLFVAVYVFVTTFFLYALFPDGIERILHLGNLVFLLSGWAISLYVLLLTMNIVNISFSRYIPLFNSAHRSLFVISLVTTFVATFAAMTFSQAGVWYGLAALTVYTGVTFSVLQLFVRLCIPSLWNARLVTLSLVAVLAVLGGVLSLLQVSIAIISFGTAIALYVGLHLVLHHTLTGFKRRFIFEYILFFLLFLGVFIIDFYI